MQRQDESGAWRTYASGQGGWAAATFGLFGLPFAIIGICGIGAALLRMLPDSPYYHIEINADGLLVQSLSRQKRYAWRDLPAFYQAKRDLFRAGLAATRLRLLPSEGSYFQCVDYSAVSDLGEEDFCRRLTTEIGVAAIPLAAFYEDGRNQGIARLCFAKRDETLRLALDRLAKL